MHRYDKKWTKRIRIFTAFTHLEPQWTTHPLYPLSRSTPEPHNPQFELERPLQNLKHRSI